MNTTTYERGGVPAARKQPRTQKKNDLKEVDLRRHRKLISRYELMRSLGKKFTLSRISVKYGYSHGRASQILHGHEPLNLEWMMIWATEMECSPVEIFEEDWPFPNLTPLMNGSHLADLVHRWNELTEPDRNTILRILKKK